MILFLGSIPDEFLDGCALPGNEPALSGVLLRSPHLVLVLHAISSHGHSPKGELSKKPESV